MVLSSEARAVPELEVEDHGRFEGRFRQRPCASSGPTERVRNTVRERMFLIRIARSPNPLRLWARWRDDNEFDAGACRFRAAQARKVRTRVSSIMQAETAFGRRRRRHAACST